MHFAALLGAEAATKDTSVNILSLNATFLIEIVAFLVLLAILSKFVFPPIVDAAGRRQRQIDEAREEAEAGRKQLTGNTAEVEAVLDGARDQARQLIAEAQKSGAADAEVSRVAGRTAAHAEIERARTEVRGERDKAAGELRDQVVTLVAAVAGRLGGGGVDDAAVERAAREAIR